jgi:hypothetical protein
LEQQEVKSSFGVAKSVKDSVHTPFVQHDGIWSDARVPVEHRGGTNLRVGIFRASSRNDDTRDDSGSKRCRKLNLRCDASKKWSCTSLPEFHFRFPTNRNFP